LKSSNNNGTSLKPEKRMRRNEDDYFAGFFRQNDDMVKLMKSSKIIYKRKKNNQSKVIKVTERDLSPQVTKVMSTQTNQSSNKLLPNLTRQETEVKVTENKKKGPKDLFIKFNYISSNKKYVK
jgi:hypothetical protein